MKTNIGHFTESLNLMFFHTHCFSALDTFYIFLSHHDEVGIMLYVDVTLVLTIHWAYHSRGLRGISNIYKLRNHTKYTNIHFYSH